MTRILPLLLLFPLLAGCRDEGPVSTVPPGSPTPALLVDGVLEDSPDVTWLMPLPPTATTVSVFNPNLEPVVEVCRLSGDHSSCAPVASFTTGGSGSDVVRVATDGDWYIVNWKFGDLPFVKDAEYLIQVSLSGVVLEEALVKRIRKGTLEIEGKKYDLDGKLPIKFQIFEASTSSARRLVTNAGGLVCTPDDFRCLDAPAGWLNLYPGTYAETGVIVNIALRTSEPCLPLALPQAGGCMSINLEDPTNNQGITLNFPDPRFAEQDHRPRAEQCLDPDANAEEYAQWKYTAGAFDPFQNPIREAGITKPEPAFATKVSCDGFAWPPEEQVLLAFEDGSLFDRARSLAQPLVAVLSPRPLFAGDVKAGSLLGSASDLGYVEEGGRINMIAGDDQTALEFAQVAIDPTVLVTAGHDFGGDGGVLVTFTASGGGEVTTDDGETFSTSVTVAADVFGRASVGWKLGSCQSSQSLEASFFDVQKQLHSVTFTATATCRIFIDA